MSPIVTTLSVTVAEPFNARSFAVTPRATPLPLLRTLSV